MSGDLSNASKCYGVYDGNDIVAFMAVIHNPHSANPKIKRVHRLVVLPDYQGIGIGKNFLNLIAKQYRKNGYDFSIVTSAKNLIMALAKDSKWNCIRYNHVKPSNSGMKKLNRTNRLTVKTASFFYQ